jgi:hypothetical protein
MKKSILLLFFSLIFSVGFAQKKKKTSFEFQKVYFQNWSGGQELSGSGTDFYISLKKPLAKNTTLDKIYFRTRETKIEKISDTLYVARFVVRAELVIDENGNRTIDHKQPEIKPQIYKLQDTEAMMEYTLEDKKKSFKFVSVVEKEMLAYP